MFYFRINKIRIIDNKENPRFLGIFGADLAQVKLISFVTTDNMNLPDMTEFIFTKDTIAKKAILKQAIKEVINHRVLTTVENVKDNHIMYFGDTGYVLYQAKNIPQHFDWQFIAYESDRNIISTAKLTQNIIQDENFDKFTDTLSSILKRTTNKAYVAAVSIGKFATKIIADIAKKNKDDMIGIIYMSLNRQEHYPHGERKKNNVPDMTNNLFIDYSIFGFEE